MKKVLLVSLLATSACYPSMRPHPFNPQAIECNLDPKEAVSRVSRAIVAADFAVESSDPTSGIIRTDWKSAGIAGGIVTVEARIRFNIVVGNGQVLVKPQPQTKSQDATLKTDWTDQNGISQREEELYNKLVAAVKSEIGVATAAAPAQSPTAP